MHAYVFFSLITIAVLALPKLSNIKFKKYSIPSKFASYLKDYPGYDLNGMFENI